MFQRRTKDYLHELKETLRLSRWAFRERCYLAATLFSFGAPYIASLRLFIRSNPAPPEKKTSPFLYTLR
jgi:hypothetical protein